MSNASKRYEIVEEIARDRAQGRATYLAKLTANEQLVIVNEFAFARIGSDWAGCDAYKQAVQSLRSLKYPGIPRYLGAFPTEDGFSTVQQYVEAKPLSQLSEVEPDQVQAIAVAVLETLVYLQEQTPPVIHRNLCPDNIWVDQSMNVYLTNFGFDYLSKDGKAKRAIAGTAGFMPREQIRDRDLNNATDLYGFGMTISCLLTDTAADNVERLMNQNGLLTMRNRVSDEISLELVSWLETMTQPYPKQRYPDAKTALAALQKINVARVPEAIVKPQILELESKRYGETLTANLSIANSVPDTELEGRWEVMQHPSEPRRTSWIRFDPIQFKKNHLECHLSIDTSKLMANRTYQRQLLLRANTNPPELAVLLKLKTAPLAFKSLPLVSIGIVLVAGLICGLGGAMAAELSLTPISGYAGLVLGTLTGLVFGLGGAFGAIQVIKSAGTVQLILWGLAWVMPYGGAQVMGGFVLTAIAAMVTGYIARHKFGPSHESGVWGIVAAFTALGGIISLLVMLAGICIGIGLLEGFGNLLLLVLILLTTTPAVGLLVRFSWQTSEAKAKYLATQSRLIRP